MTEEQVQQIATQIDQIDQIEIETESTDQVGPIEVADQVEVVAFEGAALPKPDEDRRIKQAWWWALALGLLGLLAIAGVYLYLESQVPTIEVATVEKSALTIEVTGSGQIEPDDPTDVYSKQAGIVSALHVSDGQKVIKGAPLIELDRAPLQAQLVLAEGSLAQARAGLAQAQSGAFSRSEAINAAVQGVNAAEAGLATAYEIKVLADQSVIDAQYFLDILKSYPNPDPFDIMQAEGALEQARVGQQQAIGGIAAAEGSVAAARGALAQAQSSDPDAAISAANAAIAASEEQVALAREALDEAIIKAPIAGVVLFAPTAAAAQSLAAGAGTPLSGAQLSVGSAITPGMPLFTITDPDHMLFVAEINETDIARLSQDMSATVTLDSFVGTTFEGMVTKIASHAQRTMTGTTIFPVQITLDTAPQKPAIGMKGEAAIRISAQNDVTTVPYQALFSEGNNDYVYVVSDERLIKTAVETGERTATTVEIIRGVVTGDQVALASNTAFVDAMRVRSEAP